MSWGWIKCKEHVDAANAERDVAKKELETIKKQNEHLMARLKAEAEKMDLVIEQRDTFERKYQDLVTAVDLLEARVKQLEEEAREALPLQAVQG